MTLAGIEGMLNIRKGPLNAALATTLSAARCSHSPRNVASHRTHARLSFVAVPQRFHLSRRIA
jgi:hypothetical protein